MTIPKGFVPESIVDYFGLKPSSFSFSHIRFCSEDSVNFFPFYDLTYGCKTREQLPIFSSIEEKEVGLLDERMLNINGLFLQKNEQPAAFYRKDSFYIPLYDRIHLIKTLPVYTEYFPFTLHSDVPSDIRGFFDFETCIEFNCPPLHNEQPAFLLRRFFKNNWYHEHFYYDRRRDPRWRVRLLTDVSFDPLHSLK